MKQWIESYVQSQKAALDSIPADAVERIACRHSHRHRLVAYEIGLEVNFYAVGGARIEQRVRIPRAPQRQETR